MPLFVSEDRKREFIRSEGYDPNRFDLDENTLGFIPRVTKPVVEGSPSADSDHITKLQKSAPSGLESFGRNAAEAALPTAASLGTIAAASWLAGPGAGIPTTIAALLAGAGAGIGASKLQQEIVPEEVKQALFSRPEDFEQNKWASIAGGFAPSALAFNPAAGIRDLPALGSAIRKLPGVLGPRSIADLTAVEQTALMNAAANTVPQAAISGYQQTTSDQPFDVERLLGETLPGVLFTRPTGLGKRLGFKAPPTQEELALAFKARQAGGQEQAPSPGTETFTQPSVEELLASGGVPFERTLPPSKGKLTERGVAAMEKEQYGLPGLKHRDEPILEQRAVETMEGEGGPAPRQPDVESKRELDFYKARIEKERQNAIELARLEAEQLAVENANKQRQLGMAVGAKGTAKAIMERGVSTKETRPDPLWMEAEQVKTGKFTTKEKRTPVYPQEDSPFAKQNKGLDKPLTEAERIQQEYDLGLRESQEADLKSTLATDIAALSPEQRRTLDTHLRSQATRRGFKVKDVPDLVSPEGKSIAGNIDLEKRLITLSKLKGGVETPPHEAAGHGFVNDLLRSSSKTDKELALKALNAYSKDRSFNSVEEWNTYVKENPDDAFRAATSIEETLAKDLALEGTRQSKVGLYGDRKARLKEWLAGAKSRWKKEFGLATPEDLRRHLIQRYRGDAPYGTRLELAPDLTKPIVREGVREENAKEKAKVEAKGKLPIDKVRESGGEEASQTPSPKPTIVKLATSRFKNPQGDPMGTTYRATAEDYARYQEIQGELKKAITEGKDLDSTEVMELRNENETIKNKYGGMPPEAPTNIRESSAAEIEKGMEEQLQTAAMRKSFETTKEKENLRTVKDLEEDIAEELNSALRDSGHKTSSGGLSLDTNGGQRKLNIDARDILSGNKIVENNYRKLVGDEAMDEILSNVERYKSNYQEHNKENIEKVKQKEQESDFKSQELEAFTRPDKERQSQKAELPKTFENQYLNQLKEVLTRRKIYREAQVLEGKLSYKGQYVKPTKTTPERIEVQADDVQTLFHEALHKVTADLQEPLVNRITQLRNNGQLTLDELIDISKDFRGRYGDNELIALIGAVARPEKANRYLSSRVSEALSQYSDGAIKSSETITTLKKIFGEGVLKEIDKIKETKINYPEWSSKSRKYYSIEADLPRIQEEESKYPSSFSFNRVLTSRLDKVAEKIPTNTGREVTYKMRQANTERGIMEGRIGNRLIADTEGYTPEEIAREFQYSYAIKDEQPPPFDLTPREEQLRERLNETIKELGQTFIDSGMEVSIGDDYRKMKLNPKGHRFGMLSQKVADAWAESKPEAAGYDRTFIEHAIEKGETEKSAAKILEDYKQAIGNVGITPDVNFGAIRKAQGIGLPWDLVEQNFHAASQRYGKRAATDLAFFKYIQNDPRMLKALGVKDQFGKPYESSSLAEGKDLSDIDYIGSSPEVIAAKRSLYGIDVPPNPAVATAARVIGANIMQTGTAIRNIAALPTSIAPYYGVNLKTAFDALTKMNERVKRAFENNAIKRSYKDFDAAGELEGNPNRFIQLADKYVGFMRKWTGRDLSDNFEGLFSYSLGEELASKWFALAKTGDIKARAMLNRFGTTVEGGVKKKFLSAGSEVTADDIARVAKEFVDVVRGSYSAAGLPSYAIEGPIAPFTSLSRWSIERANNFYKDAILPIKESGDWAPLLKTAFAGLLTGAAIEQLNEAISGKRGADPTVKEAVLSGRKEDIIAKAIGLAQLGALGGIASDAMKFGANLAQGKSNKFSTPVSFPLASVVEDLAQKTSFAVEAIREGEDPFPVLGEYMKELIKAQSQNARYVNAHLSDETSRKEKFRDMRVFEELSGNRRPSDTGSANPFTNLEGKEFKKTPELEEAAKMLPSLLDDIVRKSGGDYEKLKKGLLGLKANNYQIFPSPDSVPATASKFYDFLVKTQGQEAADARFAEFLEMRVKNRIKSSLVPSL